jgi:alpha-L-fucosidase
MKELIMKKYFVLIFIFWTCLAQNTLAQGNGFNNDNLKWWKDAKFGMFIHWGLYAIPAGTWKESVHDEGYSEWIMFHEKIPVAEYEKLAAQFNPVNFNADEWVKIAKDAGMKYIVITSKHHDGFSMFYSDVSEYNIVDATPFGRDVIGELADACRKEGIKFGCYYSIDRDWHHPLVPSNHHNQDNKWDYPDQTKKDFTKYLNDFAIPQVRELLTKYKPDIIWFDGIEMKTNDELSSLYNMIKELQPSCLINSRIYTYKFPEELPPPFCDFLSMDDNGIADNPLGIGWENPGTMNTSYGYNKNDNNWRSSDLMVKFLADIVSKGGNYLLNVGPTDQGVFPDEAVSRLSEIGKWLEINGEAVYGTTTWEQYKQGDEEIPAHYYGEDEKDLHFTANDIRFTRKDSVVYAICLAWPESAVKIESLCSTSGHEVKNVTLLGSSEELAWFVNVAGLKIGPPLKKVGNFAYVFKIELKNKS